jgi:hypothetical protein
MMIAGASRPSVGTAACIGRPIRVVQQYSSCWRWRLTDGLKARHHGVDMPITAT